MSTMLASTEELLDLAWSHARADDCRRAELYTRRARRDPRFARERSHIRGYLALRQSRFEEAVHLLNSCLERGYENADVWYDLGLAQEHLGQLRHRNRAFLKVLELDVADSDPRSPRLDAEQLADIAEKTLDVTVQPPPLMNVFRRPRFRQLSAVTRELAYRADGR